MTEKQTTKVHYLVPLAVMTVAGFTFNTSELLPVGLLSDIAESLGVSEARTGLLITVYAWVVALMSLPLMLVFAKVPYRKLMLWVIGLFAVSHGVTAFAPGYVVLMASRIGVALAHSLFWSIAPGMAVAVSPPSRRASSLSLLVAGGGIALIVGMPLGRMLGLVAGWRVAFGAIGLLSAAIWIMMRCFYPPIGREGASKSRKQLIDKMLHSPQLLMIYLIIGVIVTGYYTGYSYIEPFMAQVAAMSDSDITLTLSAFGVAGLAGSFVAGEWYRRHSGLLIGLACCGIPSMLLMLYPAASSGAWGIAAVCIIWGMSVTILNIALQNDIVTLFPEDSAVPMSLYSGTFNLGIGAGALVGGIAVNSGNIAEIGFIGGGIAVVIAIFALAAYIPRRLGPRN